MDQMERVFAFDDPVDFLNFELRERQKRDARFSLRAWSRQVGYKNPSYLSHVLSRKRRLKPEFAGKLASDLSLRGRPLKYFELLVMSQNAATEGEQETYRKLLASTKPRRSGSSSANELSLETFSLVADWYHWAILEMTDLEGFDPEPKAIQKKLCVKVDLKTIRQATDRLLRAGLLTRDGSGRIVRSNKDSNNETHAPAQPEAVVAYHKQMGALGLKAVAEQGAEERTFYGSTLTFRRENMKKVQDILKEAHLQVLRFAEHGAKGEDVYQLNSQFFRLAGTRRTKK
jgi:uncharacterized protein (TIGR02147 family)